MSTAPGSRIHTFFEDFYNRIHVEPLQIDFGFIGDDISTGVSIWNAFYDKPVTLEGITYNPAAGLDVTGLPYRVMPPLSSAAYSVTAATASGMVTLDEDIQWDFGVDGVSTTPVSGIRARKWVLEPNWPPSGNSYQVSYAFRTQVITSHSGREQRLAMRSSPRKSLEFEILVNKDNYRAFKDLSRAEHHKGLLVPEATRFVTTTEEQTGGTVLELPYVPNWIKAGVTVWLQYFSASEVHKVKSVAGNLVTFATLNAAIWPVGTKVHPLLVGYLASELSASKRTNDVATVPVRFDVSPLSEPVIPVPPPATMFNGREVFLKKPNWANSVEGRFGRDVEVLDYDRGPVARFYPVQFGYERQKATYLNKNSAEAQELVDFFYRMRGQQGEFYMPTWEYDFRPEGVVQAVSSGMTVADVDFAEEFRTSTVYRAMFVALADGSVLLRKVTQITPTSTGSVISVDSPWGVTFTADSILMCGWLPVRRLVSDTLVVEWVTNTVAEVTLNMTTLEDLPV